MPVDPVRLSKFLSLVLRHRPDEIGLALDPQGWAAIDELVEKARRAGMSFDRDELLNVVATSDKKRFSVSDDGRLIRAAQGHSVAVDLGLPPREPPQVLFHGTATRFLESILREGLQPRGRDHVHLSAESATARRVGERHGRPVVLTVDARGMYARGFVFHVADNGVWLTAQVPASFLTVPQSETPPLA